MRAISDGKAGCGRTASPVWWEGRGLSPSLPQSVLRWRSPLLGCHPRFACKVQDMSPL